MNRLLILAAAVATCVAQDLGIVENFHQSGSGDGYVTLEWNFIEGDPAYPIDRFSLMTDGIYHTDVRCFDAICSKTEYYLAACAEHTFSLTPMFKNPADGFTEGDAVFTIGYPDEKPPGAPSNVQVVSDNEDETTLRWDEPEENVECVLHYEVCFRVYAGTETFCAETNSTEITVKKLLACATYHITVTPVTPGGELGTELKDTFETHDGVPGPPMNVTIGLTTPFSIQLLWNNPIFNPLCFVSNVIEVEGSDAIVVVPPSSKTARRSGGYVYDNEFTFTSLNPCNNFSISISSANAAGLESEKIINYAQTADQEPEALPFVTVGLAGKDAIEVEWAINEADPCSGNFIVCWNDGVNLEELCERVDSGTNRFIISSVLSCTKYQVNVRVESPSGSFLSKPINNVTSTGDTRTGPVRCLKVTSIATDQVGIAFNPPSTNPQCVKEYKVKVIDETLGVARRQVASPYLDLTVVGLEPCTDYLFEVSTVSRTGLTSEIRRTSNRTLDKEPSEPRNLGLNSHTETSVTLEWYQPATNSRCTTQYCLAWTGPTEEDSDGTCIDDPLTFKVTHTVEDLQPCTDYNFTLVAESEVGGSPSVTLSQATQCP